MANLNYGFVDYRGNKWSKNMIDTYNRFNEQVEKRETQNVKNGSLAHKELEFYKDQRNKQFKILCEIASVSFKESLAPKANPKIETF